MSGWLPSHALTCRAVWNQTDTYEYHILVQPPCCHLIFSVISHSTTIVQSNLFSGNIFPVESFSLVMITSIFPRLYIYLSPPHEYRQNLRKSWISRVGRNRGPICFEHIGFEFIRKLGPICGGWRGMLGISDSLFTICQWRLGGFCRRKQKLAEEDGSGQ